MNWEDMASGRLARMTHGRSEERNRMTSWEETFADRYDEWSAHMTEDVARR
jgi:hypothetical protein